jgi:hypothetical protein
VLGLIQTADQAQPGRKETKAREGTESHLGHHTRICLSSSRKETKAREGTERVLGLIQSTDQAQPGRKETKACEGIEGMLGLAREAIRPSLVEERPKLVKALTLC